MKYKVCFLTTWLVLMLTGQPLFCQSNNNGYFYTDSILVTGKIAGYNFEGGDHFITFLTNELNGNDNKHAVEINNDGSFSTRILQYFKGDIVVNYKDVYVNLLVQPGKELKLEIKDTGQKITTADFTAAGEMTEVNNLLIKFQSAFDQHKFDKEADFRDKQQTDSQYASSRQQQFEEEMKFLADFISVNEVTNKTFINWQKHHFQYSAGHDVLYFLSFWKMDISVTHQQLLDFIKPIAIDNPAALGNSDYYRFLNMLCVDIQIVININPSYAPARKASGFNSMILYMDVYDKIATRLVRELLYLNAYPDNAIAAKAANMNWPRFETTIKNPLLKKLAVEKKTRVSGEFQSFSLIDKLKQEKVSEAFKQRLITFFERYKGTTLYLDFWGDWCGPCMMEMPGYPAMINSLKNQPVKFIFLSVSTTDKSMLAVKEKFKIDAEFINLNKDEESIMTNVLGIPSFPSHFVVDTKGNVTGNEFKISATKE